MSLIDEAEGVLGDFVIDSFHPLLRERTRILDLLSAFAISPAMEHASGSKALLEFRVFRVVWVFRFFLGIQVI